MGAASGGQQLVVDGIGDAPECPFAADDGVGELYWLALCSV